VRLAHGGAQTSAAVHHLPQAAIAACPSARHRCDATTLGLLTVGNVGPALFVAPTISSLGLPTLIMVLVLGQGQRPQGQSRGLSWISRLVLSQGR
jgi:hypothetical protein